MSIIPADQESAGGAEPGGFMALVHSWLISLPVEQEARAHRRTAIQRELDAFAWDLVGRLDGVAPADDGLVAEIPLDRDKPNR